MIQADYVILKEQHEPIFPQLIGLIGAVVPEQSTATETHVIWDNDPEVIEMLMIDEYLNPVFI